MHRASVGSAPESLTLRLALAITTITTSALTCKETRLTERRLLDQGNSAIEEREFQYRSS